MEVDDTLIDEEDDPRSAGARGAAEGEVSRALAWCSQSQVEATARDRFLGCLLAGAAGDALGAPVEFLSRTEILRRFGPEGVTQYAPAYGGLGRITDDTQMTLFTAEGLLRAHVHGYCRGVMTYTGVTANAYLRWLQTQRARPKEPMEPGLDGWLFQHPELHSRRAPGNTCLSALRAMGDSGGPADNDSKGCGGVMRIAPVGLFVWREHEPYLDHGSIEEAFRLGTELAALTHGHPTGSLAGGALSVLVLALADGASLTEALMAAKVILREERGAEETLRALERAEELAGSGSAPETAIAELGAGWVAEEALAIAVYCALVARDLVQGVILAVTHDGDSDSTGAIAGNLLGTMHGASALPANWLEPLELREVITELAEDLYDFRDWEIGEHTHGEEHERIWQKYPGC